MLSSGVVRWREPACLHSGTMHRRSFSLVRPRHVSSAARSTGWYPCRRRAPLARGGTGDSGSLCTDTDDARVGSSARRIGSGTPHMVTPLARARRHRRSSTQHRGYRIGCPWLRTSVRPIGLRSQKRPSRRHQWVVEAGCGHPSARAASAAGNAVRFEARHPNLQSRCGRGRRRWRTSMAGDHFWAVTGAANGRANQRLLPSGQSVDLTFGSVQPRHCFKNVLG